MKYEDKIDIYDDEGNCLAEDLPIEALSPLNNSYMLEILDFVKSTAFIDLKKLETIIHSGKVGYTSEENATEIQMPWYSRDWAVYDNAEIIAEKIQSKLQVSDSDDSIINFLPGNDVIIVRIPKKRMAASSSRNNAYTIAGVALMQAISEVFDVTPQTDPDGCGLIKNAVFGRYPQTISFPPNNALTCLLRPPQTEEGMGLGYKTVNLTDLVALTNKRTFDAITLSTILEQAAQFEMGNAIGWFERYHLLGLAYQGLNGDNLLYDLIKENREGRVGDVVKSLMQFAFEDKIIKYYGRRYPAKFFSEYRLIKANDFARWNAYMVTALLAACIVNVGASRAAQSVSAAIIGFSDLLNFESGFDPDCGRVIGSALGLNMSTHSEIGTGDICTLSMDNEYLRNTSFISPCLAAALCLDSGTQLKKPDVSSSMYFRMKEVVPLFDEPLKKVAEAAKNCKL
ncbi:MAG: coenzyme-B sulfoethylthiotransferase subunit beta [Candidatus Helarchaeota archaeon]